jgi:hypothetical protein
MLLLISQMPQMQMMQPQLQPKISLMKQRQMNFVMPQMHERQQLLMQRQMMEQQLQLSYLQV